jgi:RHS repeat-associated protein
VLSLTKKQVSGPYISTQTWAVSYSGCSSSSCNSTKTTSVTDPRNFTTVYTFGLQYGTNGTGNEGMLLRKQSGSGQRDEKYDYYSASGNPYPAVIGTPAQVRGDVSELSSLRPVQKRTLSIDGATYTRTLSSPDAYGFSRTITRTGSNTKTDTITYSHNTNDWVLGTVTRVVSDGRTEVDLTLNSHNQPTQVRHFDHTDQKLDYYNDGPVRWISDGKGNTTAFSNYKLGVPRGITYADGSTESAVVSDLGLITSHTNASGLTTGYGYDAIGRLSTITPPGGYNATTITWNPSSSGWTRKQVTGNATTTDEYDAFLHPHKTTDSTGRFVNHTYDADGRPTFESYPSNNTYGIESHYDGIGRLISEVDDQGRAINYTWGANTLSVQDRNGHSTSYSYRTYDEPSTAWPTAINRAEIGWTNVGRDTWGKPTSVNRGSTWRTYQYYSNQWLKSVTEPETGVTTFSYDDAGNISTINYDGAATETRTYDSRNRLKTIGYSDGSPSVTFNWRGDGQPDNATRGSVRRSYAYDGGGLPTGETVTINGTAYSLGYAYDGNRHLKTLTYPDNASVGLSPDAFGRPGGAGSFATSASYFPNDALQGFTYGNGIVHSLTQYTNGRPHVAQDAGVLNVTYGYDYKGNPTSIADSLNASNSRTLTYDGADRLKTATGPWGTATLTYDALDNLTGDTATGFSATLDANNRLAAATWDSRGRMMQKGSGANAVQTTFNAANLLTAIAQGSNHWSYSYDALGYRATAAGGGANTVSVYDRTGRLVYEAATAAPSSDIIFQDGFEVPTAPVTTTKYVYLGSHLVAKAIKNGAATQTVYVHTDALGSPIAQTDAGRALVGTTNYLPYGGRYGSAGAGGDPGPGYASHYDDATGLIYMRARYYDPAQHRFISTDPVDVDSATGINFNRYAYALNSPFGYIDPNGRDPCETDCEERLKAADEQVAEDARTLVGLAFAPLAGVADLVKGLATGDSKLAGEGAATAVMDMAVPELETAKTAIAVARTTEVARQLGREGEEAVRSAYDIGEKAAVQVGGRTRIPDGINEVAETVSEVKNVRYQGYTSQLRDYVQYAQDRGYQFNLFIRSDTQLSRPLQDAINCGDVCAWKIPE